jgi:putative hydrolase of the HAD superfamily
MPVNAILFDLDDTLIQESAAVARAFLATADPAARRHGLDPEQLHQTARRRSKELWLAHPDHPYASRIGISSWEALWARFLGSGLELGRFRAWAPEFRLATWRRALSDCGVEDEPLAPELARRFVEERRKIHRLFPEARSVLGMMREAGDLRLGLVTNGLACLQREKIQGAGLEAYFDAICVSGDVGEGKPDAKPFRVILERLGVQPDEALMVGDRLDTDVAGARSAGIRAVWLDRENRALDDAALADARIASLEELVRWVPRLRGG